MMQWYGPLGARARLLRPEAVDGRVTAAEVEVLARHRHAVEALQRCSEVGFELRRQHHAAGVRRELRQPLANAGGEARPVRCADDVLARLAGRRHGEAVARVARSAGHWPAVR